MNIPRDRDVRIRPAFVSCATLAASSLLAASAEAQPAAVTIDPPDQAVVSSATTRDGPVSAYFDAWSARAKAVRAAQPAWSSPIVTTTALIEQRARFDTAIQRSGNGANTVNLDGGRGLDLIVSETQEIQIAADPYEVRTNKSGKGRLQGFADWPVLRFKQRLASSPEGQGDYILSAWVQAQAPTGVAALSNHAYTLLPTIGFGKGFGRVVVQGTFGMVLPTAYENTVGTQLATNVALQCHLSKFLWPQIEVNWTKYLDGTRGGKNQVLLTPGLVIGRVPIGGRLGFSVGVGYQTAVAPKYRPSPLLPAYDHAWIVTTRLSF